MEQMKSGMLTKPGYHAALAQIREAVDAAAPPVQQGVMRMMISSLESAWSGLQNPLPSASPAVVEARQALARGYRAQGSFSEQLTQVKEAWAELGRILEEASPEDRRIIGREAGSLATLMRELEARSRAGE